MSRCVRRVQRYPRLYLTTRVRGGWTSAIFLELLFFADIHSYKFGMVRMDHTSSRWFDLITYIFTGDRRSEGAICTRLMRFKSIEPHWPCTEPYSTTSLRGIQGVQGALCTSSRKFKHSEPHRTTSMKSFFYTSSEWLDLIDLSWTTFFLKYSFIQIRDGSNGPHQFKVVRLDRLHFYRR